MRTVKKALALVLAFALAFSMMAGAAFTDSSSIKTLDAVNTLSALGIITGYPDGSFKPDQIVTRAEMAKMIYVLKNAGRDDGAVYFKSSVNAFYDVKGHWAEGYVNYAYTLGIIAGKGNGIFDPDASVTALEAAKMLLVVLGYNATTEGLVGSQWAIKTAALAQTAKLFDKYGAGLGEGAPRQYVAQMLSNALDAAIVQYNDNGLAVTQYDLANKAITLGSRTVSTKNAETILEANENYAYDSATSAPDGKITLAANTGTGSAKVTAGSYTFDGSDELVGQKVKVMYKEVDGSDGLTSGDTVIGLAALASNNVVSFIRGDIDTESATEIKMKTTGIKYKIAGSVNKILNNWYVATAASVTDEYKKTSADKITLIDSDADGYYDVIKQTAKLFSKVTSVGSTAIGLATVGNLDKEDNTLYDGIAKDDYVLVTPNYNSATTKEDYIVEKVTPVVAELSGRNSSGDLYVNGAYVSVEQGGGYVAGASAADFYFGKGPAPIGGDPKLGDDITLYMYGKYWVAAKAEAASDDYCVVLGADAPGNLDQRAKVLFPDGTKGTYVIDTDGAAPAVNTVYAYSLSSSSSKIKLTAIATVANKSGSGINSYDKDTQTTTAGSAVGTKVLDSNTIIFAMNTDAGVATLDSRWKALKFGDIKDIDITSTFAGAYDIDNATLDLVTFGKVGGVAAGGSNKTYGFLTAAPSYVLSGDDYLVTYTIWDGTQSLTKTMNIGTGAPDFSTISNNAVKGGFVAFKNKADGNIVDTNDASNELKDLSKTGATLDGTNFQAGRIFNVVGDLIGVGLLGTDIAATDFYQITNDTQIIFVEADDNKSASAGDVTTFDTTKNGTTTAFNAFFVYDTSTSATNDIEVLFIDIDSTIKA